MNVDILLVTYYYRYQMPVKISDKIADSDMTSSNVRVATERSGPFMFQIGVDFNVIALPLREVEVGHQYFTLTPILPELAVQLEREVVASSVYGTTTIEGGTLTEEETAAVLDESPPISPDEQERAVLNIRNAYELVEGFVRDAILKENPGGQVAPLVPELILDVHKAITEGLTHSYNVPGQYRDEVEGAMRTRVGDAAHGGAYAPPKTQRDIKTLMDGMCNWLNSPALTELSPLVRAPLAHLYFELIHPFWDGNGRTGRVLEAYILTSAGYTYAPFAMARYYAEHVDEYFIHFNACRKAAAKGKENPNTPFVEFFLKGMAEVLLRLHRRSTTMVGVSLFRNRVDRMRELREINDRQHTIMDYFIQHPRGGELGALQRERWYRALYKDRTHRTAKRDLQKLLDARLIHKVGAGGDIRYVAEVPTSR